MNKGTSKHIAIATAAVVSVGAFGVGAISLAQANPDFNPDNFTSAYSKGLDDESKGYQANPVDTDGQANRNKENADNNDKSTEGKQSSQDAFSSTPQQGPSGTTAYNITGNANNGGLTIANGNSTNNASGASNNGSNATNGPVITPTDNPGGNGNGNGSSGENNGGNANNGGSGDNNNGNGGAGGNTDPTPTPTPTPRPWQPSYIPPTKPLLPNDPVYSSKPNPDTDSDPVNDSNSKLGDIDKNLIFVSIYPETAPEFKLYAGQTPDAWTVFCGLNAYFSYFDEDFESQSAEWRCTREQFATYPYFKIDKYPSVIPDEAFDIRVAYRISTNDEWTYETVRYEPAPSRTYILGTTLDENGNSKILFSYSDNDINLFFSLHSLMNSSGYLQTDGTLSRLLLNWQEDGKDLDFFYQPEGIGRHVIAPGRFVDIPDGYTVKLKNVWMNSDYSGAPADGKNACSLQTITGVSPSASCMLVPDRYGRITLTATPGIQAISIEAEPVTVDRLELSDTTWYVNTTNGLLRVKGSYSVSSNNPNYASLSNGILANKQETEYLGIPLSLKTLDVPEGIQSVNFTPGNSLEHITLNAIHTGEIPVGNWENLRNCNVLVDDEIFDAFSTANRAYFDVSTGNTISMKSDPHTKYCYSNDTLISSNKAVHFVDTGVDLVRVADAHTLTAGCLENCPNITTLVFTDNDPYWLENGCLAGSNVRTIVCSTEEQVDYVYRRLQASGTTEDVYVTKAVTTDEGYRFFDSIDDLGLPANTVFEVPDSTRTFNGVGNVEGHGQAFSTIAPGTFENHPNLAWANLADSVRTIGADAFSGCSKLQGVFIANTDTITVGENAFANCARMRFIASNAYDGQFSSDEKPNENCLMYAPTYSMGYHINFVSFTPESGVESYAADEQEDGSIILYGASDGQGEWLLLAAGGEINGDMQLSSDVIEIFSNAFKDTKGNFTINWSDLFLLQYIDQEAFKDSNVSGDVTMSPFFAYDGVISADAFSGCKNITSFSSSLGGLVLGETVFSNCTGLESVSLDILGNDNNNITPGLFAGCTNLRNITFNGYAPVSLTLISPGMPFLFDSDNTYEYEEANLRIHIPDYAQEAYLREWLYPMVGNSGYDSYYKAVYKELMIEKGDIVPGDLEVRQRMSENLTRAENHLRTMMGLPLVETSSFLTVFDSDDCTYMQQDGKCILVKAPADATVINIDDLIPDGVDTMSIGSKAFLGCENLERVILTDKIDALYNRAFAGCDGVTVELPETVNTCLLGGDPTLSFTFGANVRLQVPENAISSYLEAWPMQCLGVSDQYFAYLHDELTDAYDYAERILKSGWTDYGRPLPELAEYCEAVNQPFVEPENYLRGLMGLGPIASTDELTHSYDPTGIYTWYQTWYEPDPSLDPGLPDLPDFPDFPDLPDLPDLPDMTNEGDGNSGNNGNNPDGDAADKRSEAGKEAEAGDAEAPADGNGVADSADNPEVAADGKESEAAVGNATEPGTQTAIENQSEQAADDSAPIAEMPA